MDPTHTLTCPICEGKTHVDGHAKRVRCRHCNRVFGVRLHRLRPLQLMTDADRILENAQFQLEPRELTVAEADAIGRAATVRQIQLGCPLPKFKPSPSADPTA